jgi:cob(I)alamin adenosyltransferase
MRIYTRKGDTGQTGLLGGPRVGKDSIRLETYGTVDELNAVVGLVRAEELPEDLDRLLAQVQSELFEVGAELASPDPVARGTRTIGPRHVEALEGLIDQYDAALDPLGSFILPGGTRAAAELHFARTVCRRAERRLVTLMRQSDEEISPHLLKYLNRLGDLLFVLARAANARSGRSEMPWRKQP